MFNKSCQWLDSNPGPVISEVTAMPTAPHHCPYLDNIVIMLGKA